MRLTQHFHLPEFIASETAERLGIPNRPTTEHMRNIAQLAYAMECLRSGVYNNEYSMVITSGYRCPQLNAAVKGVKTSAHATGYAADFYFKGRPILVAARDVADFLKDSDLPFDQFILETGRAVMHFSVGPKFRRQILTQEAGPGTPVVPGIVT